MLITQPHLNSLLRRFCPLTVYLCRLCSSDGKRESYFSAIGGRTDEPPPHLSPQEVTEILRSNEITISPNNRIVNLIECNQLASNHPIEDRLKIVKFNFSNDLQVDPVDETLALAVFDGHGGGSCADIISQRLFKYLAISLSPSLNTDDCSLHNLVDNLFSCPQPIEILKHKYDERAAEFLQEAISRWEEKSLSKFASEEMPGDISKAILKAFRRCDSDLSQEIEQNLLSSPSNILLHYYLSLAVSGCCVTLLLLHKNVLYVASCGDCKAVLGLTNFKAESPILKAVDLSREHNSDNISELKRIFSTHPQTEQNNVIRNNRLLGQLMPLRAFGDFNYKWTTEKMKKLGLTRAFGSHVVPPFYLTPPYLIADPEIEEIHLSELDIDSYDNRFIILATDGLWEHFESTRNVVKAVFKHRMHKQVRRVVSVNSSSTVLNVNDSTSSDRLLDTNCATHLIRTALSCDPSADPHLDKQHARLETYLTLPQSVVRNFRDDISLIVLELE